MGNKQRKPTKYVITETSKKDCVMTKVHSKRVRCSPGIFIRVCMNFLPGPTTLVRYMRQYSYVQVPYNEIILYFRLSDYACKERVSTSKI